jgi:hypothetical protein
MALNSSSEPTSIRLQNCSLEGSQHEGYAGLFVVGVQPGVQGSVLIENSRVKHTNGPGVVLGDLTEPELFAVQFSNTSIEHVASATQTKATLAVIRGGNKAFLQATTMGGVFFDGHCVVVNDCARSFFLIEDQSGAKPTKQAIAAVNISYTGAVHVPSLADCEPTINGISSTVAVNVHPTCVATRTPNKLCDEPSDDISVQHSRTGIASTPLKSDDDAPRAPADFAPFAAL